MRTLLLPIICLIHFMNFGQSNPFEKLNYDKVVAYEYQGQGGLLIERCIKEENEKINKTHSLTEEQRVQLEKLITSKESYGSTTMACFDPHFGIVYYLNKKIVATISICLECNYLTSTEKIPATELKWIKISDEYSYPANGFSKRTFKELHSFIKKLGFTKFLKPIPPHINN